MLRDVESGARVIDERAVKYNNPFNDVQRKAAVRERGRERERERETVQ